MGAKIPRHLSPRASRMSCRVQGETDRKQEGIGNKLLTGFRKGSRGPWGSWEKNARILSKGFLGFYVVPLGSREFKSYS